MAQFARRSNLLQIPLHGHELDEPPVSAEHKLADVATFPSPSPAVSNPQAPKLAEAPKTQRVVITPDGLVTALQGRLQQAAEKARSGGSQASGEALREALSSLNDVRESSVREIQELFPTRVEAMRPFSKEEFAGEVASHWKEQMEKYAPGGGDGAALEKQAAELRRELGEVAGICGTNDARKGLRSTPAERGGGPGYIPVETALPLRRPPLSTAVRIAKP